jgi:hypothetical protein
MKGMRDRRDVTGRDERDKLRGPAFKFLPDLRNRRGGVGEINGGEPVARLGEHHIGVERITALAMRHDRLARRRCAHRAAADRCSTRGMAGVSIEQIGFDRCHAGIFGDCKRQQRAHSGPGAVRADQQLRLDARTVGERYCVSALTNRPDAADPTAPSHGTGRKRVQQHRPQLAALHFRASTGAVIGLVEQVGAVPVEYPKGLTTLEEQTSKCRGQAGRFHWSGPLEPDRWDRYSRPWVWLLEKSQ